MRICYFGTYRAHYSRNQIMIEGLRRNGVEVAECHVPLWHGVEDRVQAASGKWLTLGFIGRVIRIYWELLRVYRTIGSYDVMVLGYPGQLDVCLARVLTWLRRKPLVLDVFMSLYLVASERGLTVKHRTTARLIYWIEKLACWLPDLLVLDTSEYVRWFQDVYGLNPSRFRLVPTGADDRVFSPVEAVKSTDSLFRVLYYGTFIPNHGVEHIIEAAKILRDEADIRFDLVGDGPTKSQVVMLAREYGLLNVTFVDWVDKQILPYKIAEVDVCLGAFGTTPQSLMTVQNKIYEGLAMGKPVISGDSPAVRQSLIHCDHIYLCARANPQSLADAVSTLKANADLRRRLAENGYRLYQSQFNLQHLGARYAFHLRELITSCSSARA